MLKGTTMTKLKVWSGVGGLLALLFVLAAAVPAIVPARAEAGENSWKGVTILYTSDIKGKIEPCG